MLQTLIQNPVVKQFADLDNNDPAQSIHSRSGSYHGVEGGSSPRFKFRKDDKAESAQLTCPNCSPISGIIHDYNSLKRSLQSIVKLKQDIEDHFHDMNDNMVQVVATAVKFNDKKRKEMTRQIEEHHGEYLKGLEAYIRDRLLIN